MLKKVFTFDAAFAGLSGATLLVLSGAFADILGWKQWVVAAIGAALLAYFPLLLMVVRSKDYSGLLAKLSFGGDVGWVLGSVAVLVGISDQTDTAGKWLIAGAAAVVADIGLIKFVGWRKDRTPEPVLAPAGSRVS